MKSLIDHHRFSCPATWDKDSKPEDNASYCSLCAQLALLREQAEVGSLNYVPATPEAVAKIAGVTVDTVMDYKCSKLRVRIGR